MTDITAIKGVKGLKFCHLNVRSLLNKIDQFKLHFAHSGFDVIMLSETWLDKDISSSILELEGYQIFRNDRAFVDSGNDRIKRGGGLLTLVHNELNFTGDHDIAKNISLPDCEMQRLELSSAHQKNIVVYNIYRPPLGSVDSCVELLNHSLENENNLSNKELICMGDFNVNLKEQGPQKESSWRGAMV